MSASPSRAHVATCAGMQCTLASAQHLGLARAPARSSMRKHWFFCSAVVIRMQCTRSPRAHIASHSWLGGQHGEEAKEGSESGGEEGREEDQAPEEEVTHARLSSLRLRMTSMTASHGPARVGQRTAHRDRCSAPPAPVGDRGRRRDRGSGLIAHALARSAVGQGGRRRSGPRRRRRHPSACLSFGLSPTPSRSLKRVPAGQ